MTRRRSAEAGGLRAVRGACGANVAERLPGSGTRATASTVTVVYTVVHI